MKNVAILLFMILVLAMAPMRSSRSAEVDCVDCINQQLVDESPIDDVRQRARSLSSIAEIPAEQISPQVQEVQFRGFEHPASSNSRPVGRAPSITTEDSESFSIH